MVGSSRGSWPSAPILSITTSTPVTTRASNGRLLPPSWRTRPRANEFVNAITHDSAFSDEKDWDDVQAN